MRFELHRTQHFLPRPPQGPVWAEPGAGRPARAQPALVSWPLSSWSAIHPPASSRRAHPHAASPLNARPRASQQSAPTPSLKSFHLTRLAAPCQERDHPGLTTYCPHRPFSGLTRAGPRVPRPPASVPAHLSWTPSAFSWQHSSPGPIQPSPSSALALDPREKDRTDAQCPEQQRKETGLQARRR